MRVLLIDDSVQVVDRLKAMLQQLPGIEIVGAASDIPEALVSIHTIKPDVVLLDLHLPSGGGIKVLETIRNEKLPISAVVLTNYAFPQYRKKCTEAGAYAFLDKSTDFVKVPEVLAKLRESLDPEPLPHSKPRMRVSS